MTDQLDELDLESLRARRRQVQELEDGVSYVRRVAQGRADLVHGEIARREEGASLDATPDGLRGVLADRLLGEPGRPPRPANDQSEHPLAVELDELCAELGFGRVRELDPPALEHLVRALDDFERRVSVRRREIFAELDTLTDELVRRLAASSAEDPERRP